MSGADSNRDLGALLGEVADWGDLQFPGSTWAAKSKHLIEEAEEVHESEGDGEELADVVMIVAHLARMKGIDLYVEVERKLAICKARKWLPPDENGVVRHAESTRLVSHLTHHGPEYP